MTNGSTMNMSRRIATDLVRPSNVVTLASSSINIGHPATFPIGLPEFFIKLMTKENDVVLDCFNGSGTTTLAAMRLSRQYLGIEKDEKYCAMAEKRIAREFVETDPSVMTFQSATVATSGSDNGTLEK